MDSAIQLSYNGRLECSREFFVMEYHILISTEEKINRRVTQVRSFEVCVAARDALRMFIAQVLASQFPFLDNRTG